MSCRCDHVVPQSFGHVLMSNQRGVETVKLCVCVCVCVHDIVYSSHNSTLILDSHLRGILLETCPLLPWRRKAVSQLQSLGSSVWHNQLQPRITVTSIQILKLAIASYE